jgi:hypothetical protein
MPSGVDAESLQFLVRIRRHSLSLLRSPPLPDHGSIARWANRLVLYLQSPMHPPSEGFHLISALFWSVNAGR